MLKDGDIRRKYYSAERNNIQLTIRDFCDKDTEKLELFWKEWSEYKSTTNEKFVSHTKNDQRFFD